MPDQLDTIYTATEQIKLVAGELWGELAEVTHALVESEAQRIAIGTAFEAYKLSHPDIEPEPEPRPNDWQGWPTGSKWLGASVDDVPGLSRYQAQEAQEQRWGRKNILPHYFLNGSQWSDQIEDDVAGGRHPIISIKFGAWADVSSGALDATVRQFAQNVKALAGWVFVTFHHEPTDDGTATAFVAMWRHCVDIFREEGVTNAKFLWTQIAYDLRETGPAWNFWPGDTYVDAVGADPYNWPPKPGANWLPFATIVQHSVKFARAKAKPLVIAETGTNEDPGGNANRKAYWFTEMLAYLKTADASGIVGVCYFDNIHVNTSTGIRNDWRTNSSAISSAAWKVLATDPIMSAGL